MNTLPLSKACSYVSGSSICLRSKFVGSDLNRSSLHVGNNAAFTNSGQQRRYGVFARVKKVQKHDYPWPDDIDPNMESGQLSYLSHFKPLTEKPKPVTLDFEKPLVELERKIIDVRKMADETGLDFSDQIISLESKYQQALKDLYTHLTPIQRLSIARHPNRPTFLDHVLNITEKWVELHGDRAGYDDPAIVTGIGSIDGKSYMFIGHQKGRNTKENIQRNFGMPTPHGYRKALRMMRYADHHGFPIITFIDTPGAFADIKSEELGQGEAIAHNLREMFGLKVPIVTVVIGEGGSGGALAIGCSNKLFMLENAVFYVASPEACAAILWKSAKAAPKAAEKLKITANELCKLKIADGIIPEPIGGAHTDPWWTSQQIKIMVTKAMEELGAMDIDGLLNHRHQKFRQIGGFIEGQPVDEAKKRNMKKKEINIPQAAAEIAREIENLKKTAVEANGSLPFPAISSETVEKLSQEVENEMAKAFVAMGLQEKLESIRMEISKSNLQPGQAINPMLKEKANRLIAEFQQNLSRPGSFLELKQKVEMLSDATRLEERQMVDERLEKEINDKLQGKLNGRMNILRETRRKVLQGEALEEAEVKEVEKVKAEMEEMLRSLNLEVVGVSEKAVPSALPALEDTVKKIDKLTQSEIEKAIDTAVGLRAKIDSLKMELARGSSKEDIDSLAQEVREAIAAAVDAQELRRKVEAAVADGGAKDGHVGVPAQETAGAGTSYR